MARRTLSLSIERLGTLLFVISVLAIAAAVTVSFAMNSAADDLRAQAALAAGQFPDTPRAVWATWLAERIETPGNDPRALQESADELDHRADRIRELAGAASVGALVLMLATAKPDRRLASSGSATSAAATTRSNGKV